jgi:hypothetical protein
MAIDAGDIVPGVDCPAGAGRDYATAADPIGEEVVAEPVEGSVGTDLKWSV